VARWVLVSLALAAVLAALVGLAFAGSPARIAHGVEIAGVEVGGLTPGEARRLLASRFDRVERVPVVFTAGGAEFPIRATTLSVEADWAAAIETAAREGEGFGPIRGFRRLETRFFGAEIAPPVRVYEAALEFKLAQLAREIDQRHVEAKLVRRGLQIEVVAGQPGRRLDQDGAARRIVRALARLERGRPVALPVIVDPVDVTAADLAPAARAARLALSAPVRLRHGETRWRLPRWRIAELLSLPVAGETGLAVAGPGAEAWFERLRGTVEQPPVDASFRTAGDGVEIAPARDGLAVDVPATARNILEAATAPGDRTAALVVRTAEAERTTAEAQAMGIERRLASYTTAYAGTSDRITNLQLGVTLVPA
jgi:vancomycin resistance protein YoaR